jgi:proton-dependent oligopeptide transporter, POT family
MSKSPKNSRPSSPTNSDSDDLPTNVSSEEQLKELPEECLSGDADRPLRHYDESGEEYHYSLSPMSYAVVYILVVELLERFCFYGINYTQTSYLTGAYNEHWNADMEAITASSYVSISVAVAYTAPFIGAFLADSYLGEYWTTFVGTLGFYLPGLIIIALTTIPGLLGKTFNKSALSIGLLALWPIGTGIVKALVNVFGAKQFHPLLQSSLIEAYYVKFYMCINIGALLGGVIVPLLAQYNVTIAYFLPVCMLTIGIGLFALGSKRYVRQKPKGNIFGKKKKYQDDGEKLDLSVILRISFLTIPFSIAYSQMATTFIVQGTVMQKAFKFVDAACMNNADAIAVLLFGHVVGDMIYPAMADRGINFPTTYKFALGSLLGALSIAWALFVEYRIRTTFEETGEKISILWQSMSYILIGAGEIFAVSAAYEVAFTAAPPEKKVIASALNLFAIGGIPNVICIILYNACRSWFANDHGTVNITKLRDYNSSHVHYYFMLLFAISLIGVVINLIPSVRRYVESIEEKATEMIKTPKTPIRPPRRERELEDADEETALLRAKKHRAYLKYGAGPVLIKHGSMRAGASISRRKSEARILKKMILKELYSSDGNIRKVTAVISPKGRLVKGALLAPQSRGRNDAAEDSSSLL